MTEIEPHAREKVIEVSGGVLNQICPERALSAPPSRLAQLMGYLRQKRRLLTTRLWFLSREWQPIRCRLIQIRLWLKLRWTRFRRRRLG